MDCGGLMTVELPLVTGWLLPWDPLRLRKLMAVVLGSILEVEKEEVTFLALDTHTVEGVKLI